MPVMATDASFLGLAPYKTLCDLKKRGGGALGDKNVFFFPKENDWRVFPALSARMNNSHFCHGDFLLPGLVISWHHCHA